MPCPSVARFSNAICENSIALIRFRGCDAIRFRRGSWKRTPMSKIWRWLKPNWITSKVIISKLPVWLFWNTKKNPKIKLITAWQSLPEYGVSLFVVKFMGQRKEELLGVAFNRLMRMDMTTGDHIKTWRFNTMKVHYFWTFCCHLWRIIYCFLTKAWNVNWEVKHMMVQFEEENVIFSCLSADCKVVHEFIGGYIFLSMRSKEANQTLNEELFHKLTGGWS